MFIVIFTFLCIGWPILLLFCLFQKDWLKWYKEYTQWLVERNSEFIQSNKELQTQVDCLLAFKNQVVNIEQAQIAVKEKEISRLMGENKELNSTLLKLEDEIRSLKDVSHSRGLKIDELMKNTMAKDDIIQRIDMDILEKNLKIDKYQEFIDDIREGLGLLDD